MNIYFAVKDTRIIISTEPYSTELAEQLAAAGVQLTTWDTDAHEMVTMELHENATTVIEEREGDDPSA